MPSTAAKTTVAPNLEVRASRGTINASTFAEPGRLTLASMPSAKNESFLTRTLTGKERVCISPLGTTEATFPVNAREPTDTDASVPAMTNGSISCGTLTMISTSSEAAILPTCPPATTHSPLSTRL